MVEEHRGRIFLMSRKKIIVFVRNKLITVDTVIPILIELKQLYDIQSNIIVFDELAHNGIRENVVIRDAVRYVGKELYITNGIKNKVLRRARVVFYLSSIILDIFRGSKILHFGALDQYPLSMLGYIFRKNVYLMQGNAYDFKYSKYKSIAGNNPIKRKLTGDNLVVFGENHNYNTKDKIVYKFEPPKTRNSWLQYVYNKNNFYFKHYHNNIETSQGIIVLIMSSLDGYSPVLRNPYQTQVDLFKKTLSALSEFSKKNPIFIKPHIYTNMQLLNDLTRGVKGISITYLHPSILATKSKVFIANEFSNTLADAHSLGVKTVEFTDYSDKMLKATKGKSIDSNFVSYFINNDISRFKEVVTSILNKDFNLKKSCGNIDDKSGFLQKISQ
jgi:hypothetical protein